MPGGSVRTSPMSAARPQPRTARMAARRGATSILRTVVALHRLPVVVGTLGRIPAGALADRLDRLPAGSRVVVRALPGAGAAPSSALGADLDRALDKVLDEVPPR